MHLCTCTYLTGPCACGPVHARHLQETHERSEKDAFETITTTKAELESWRLKFEELQKEYEKAEQGVCACAGIRPPVLGAGSY